MFATKRFNRSAVTASISFLLAAGAIAAMPVSAAHAQSMPRFSLHVQAPRVSDDTIQKIQPGMSQGDIENLIGTPARTMRFPLSHTTSWDYDFKDTWGYRSVFSVIFNDEGTVASKVSIRTPY